MHISPKQSMNDNQGGRAMKRLVVLVGVLVCLLSACRMHYTSTDLLAQILALPTARDAKIYFKGADSDDEGYLPLEDRLLLYRGKDPTELSEDYALALGKDDSLFEVHIYRGLDAQQADEVEVILRDRLNRLQKKENEFYLSDGSMIGGTIWRKGNWIVLIVCDDNESVLQLLRTKL